MSRPRPGGVQRATQPGGPVPTPLEQWVEEVARTTRPQRIVWCDGSEQQQQEVVEQMLREGSTLRLNPQTYPNCLLHRSHPNDVARTENVTFICTREKDDAGPTNNWMSPAEAKQKVGGLFSGAMTGRTMYVVPYILGPVDSPISKVGVEVTDSAYVVASMRIMARVGKAALDRLGRSADFVPGLHSLGDLNPERRYILQFPEEKLIWSIGSGYGGNALLGKKCFALRIASWMAREQGWMAEHMLILGLEDPSGKVTYMAAAFPSACGKTNLAMMISALESQGNRGWTIGKSPAAHPNSRYTVPANQAPHISPHWEDPSGVPISAFIFGGRRARVAPLVYESFGWQHGVFVGAMMASETTAAATGAVGVTRRDPMAMLPFCGYNMADYFRHWLEMGKRTPHPPKIFHVNWFRKGADGKFLWPGFGENVRVLKWILERVQGKGKAAETPIGWVPTPDGLTLDGLEVSSSTMEELLRVNPADWTIELVDTKKFFEQFGRRLPPELHEEHSQLAQRFERRTAALK